MPAVSQQQQKIMGLALSVKRGDTPRSEVSDEVLSIVDSMSQKDLEKYAGTKHTGLPKKVEQKIREMVREIYNELNEMDSTYIGYVELNGMKKKKVGEFKNVSAAKRWLTKNSTKYLTTSGVNSVGYVIKSEWDNDPFVIESVNEGRYDKDLDKVENAVKNASSFMEVGRELKKAGIKYDFSTSMMPMYRIKISGNTIAIVNKKYASGAEREVGDIAIGLLENLKKVNELKKLPNGNFSIKKGYNTFADYEKNAKPGDTILKYDKRGSMIKTFVNGSELDQNAKKYLSKVHSIVGDKVNLSLFGKQGIATVPDYEKKEVGVLVLESLNESSSRRAMDLYGDNKHGQEIHKLLRGRWNDKKVEIYLDKVGGSDVKNARIIDFITKDAGLNPRKFKTLGDQIPQLLSTLEILYKDYLKSNESVNEGISVFDERHFGKTGIIIMIDDNGKKVSAIFKDKKNADKFNRNNPSDVKKLLDLAKKTKYPNAIDESVNESSKPKVVTKKQWDRTHPDYKKMIKDKPYMMWFDKKTQSTVFGPVVIKETSNPKSITEIIKTYKPGDGEKIADMYASNLKGEERYTYTLRVIDVLVDKNLITKQVSEKLRQELATQLVRLRKSKTEYKIKREI